MVVHEIVIAVAGLMAAGIVKGATGIGYSTTALPIVALAIGLDRAMPLVILPSIASNLIVLRDAGAMRETVIRFRSLFMALLPGLAIGLAALAWIDTQRAARVLGGVIALYAIYALARPPLRMPEGSERLLNIPVGLINGLINGLTGSQIMPVVPYALSLGLTTEGVLQLTNISFTVSSLVMLVGLYKIGLADGTTFLVSALCILPGAMGVMLGTRLRRGFAERTFRTLVLVVLMVLGVLLITGR